MSDHVEVYSCTPKGVIRAHRVYSELPHMHRAAGMVVIERGSVLVQRELGVVVFKRPEDALAHRLQELRSACSRQRTAWLIAQEQVSMLERIKEHRYGGAKC